jgi:hypothetical protein
LGEKRRAAAGVAGDGAEERVAGVEHGWEGGVRASGCVEYEKKTGDVYKGRRTGQHVCG